MKRTRHTPEQVIRKLRDADRMLAEQKAVAQHRRHLLMLAVDGEHDAQRMQDEWLLVGRRVSLAAMSATCKCYCSLQCDRSR